MFLRRLTWVAVLVSAGTLLWTKLADADLWWHVIVGRWILANHAVPQVDFWNIFSVGKPWRAYSWSNEVVYSGVESAWGLPGLLVFQCGLAIMLAVILAAVFSRAASSAAFGLLLTLPVLFCLHQHFALRPQTITWMLFALLLSAGFRLSRFGPQRRTVAGVLALLVFWANTHFSSVLAMLMVTGICLTDSQRERATSKLILLVFAMFAMTFLTPYFGGEWMSFFESAKHPISYTSITEFTPGTFQQPVVLVFCLMLVLLGIALHYRQHLLTHSQLITLAGFVVLGLGIIKFLPFAVIFVGYVLALAWGQTEGRPALLGELGTGIAQALSHLSRPRHLYLLLFGAVLVCVQSIVTVLSGAAIDENSVPQAAVDYIQQQRLPTPLLSGFNEGGYLIYRFSDEFGLPLTRVALDGRTNVNDPQIFRAFERTFNGSPGWNDLIDIVTPGTILWNNSLPLGSILETSGRWKRVFGAAGQLVGWSVFVPADLSGVISRGGSAGGNGSEPRPVGDSPRGRLADVAQELVTAVREDSIRESSQPGVLPAFEIVDGFWVALPLKGDSICVWKGLPETTFPTVGRETQRALVWFRAESRPIANSGNILGMTPVVIPASPEMEQTAAEPEREFDE